jgi:hypothetical protein
VLYRDPSGRFCVDIPGTNYDFGTTCNHVSVASQIAETTVGRFSGGFVQHGIDAIRTIDSLGRVETYRGALRGVGALYNQPGQSARVLKESFITGATLAGRGAKFLATDPVGAAQSLNACEWGGLAFDIVSTYLGIKGLRQAASLRAARAAKALDAVEDSAHSAAQGAQLQSALSFEEPFSNFTNTGEINPEVITQSQQIISGNELRNPAVISELTSDGSNIADWGKWESPTSGSPLGNFRIHFYRNRVTHNVNYNIDYKVKLALPGQPEIPVSQFLDELRRLMSSTP